MDGKYLDRERLFEQRTPVVVVLDMYQGKENTPLFFFCSIFSVFGKKEKQYEKQDYIYFSYFSQFEHTILTVVVVRR